MHWKGAVERHPNRENVIALYLKEKLGAAEVKTLVDHPSHEIVYYVDAAPSARLSGRSSSALQ